MVKCTTVHDSALLIPSQVSGDTGQLKSAHCECSLPPAGSFQPYPLLTQTKSNDWDGGHQASADLIHTSGMELISHGT